MADDLVTLFFVKCGLPFNEKCDMHSLMNRVIKFLGISYGHEPLDRMRIFFDEVKLGRTIEKLEKAIDEVVEMKAKLEIDVIQKCIGSMVHINSIRMVKDQTIQLGWLYSWLCEETFKSRIVRKARRQNLLKVFRIIKESLIECPPSEIVELSNGKGKNPVHVFTDAADPKNPFIGGCVYAKGKMIGFSEKYERYPRYIKHLSHIGIWEALAVLVAVNSFASIIKKNRVIFHIDNLGDTFAFAKGTYPCPTRNVDSKKGIRKKRAKK